MGRMLNDMWDNESTHQEGLAWAVAATAGSVIEFGGGFYSTPMLHGMCAPTKRPLWTIENNQEWAEQLSMWATEWHRVVASAPHIPEAAGQPGVVFVDHDSEGYAFENEQGLLRWMNRPGTDRANRVLEAHERDALIVVVHDTQPIRDFDEIYPGIWEAMDTFKHQWTYKLPEPGAWTTLCSDYIHP